MTMRDLLTNNMGLKLFSLMLSMILWLYVVNTEIQKETRIVEKTVEIKDFDKSRFFAHFNNALKVQITFQGDRKLIASKKIKESISAYVSFEGLQPGSHEIPIRVSVPEGVEYLSIRPSRFPVVVYSLHEKHMQVEYYAYNISDGYYIRDISIKPNSVVVKGKKEEIDKAEKALVSIDVGRIQNEQVNKCEVLILDSATRELRNLNVVPDKVLMKVRVFPWPIVEKPVNPVIEGKVADGYRIKSIEVVPERVDIKGHPDEIRAIEYADTEKISVEGITAGIRQKAGLVLSSKKAQVVGTDKVTITVKIEKIQ